jgi:5-oxopent-3-ene-1,2,5-tricarboxylate decarboxylase/2-hydroxyhepta-2,4-diene-1,7-dioate isomerase
MSRAVIKFPGMLQLSEVAADAASGAFEWNGRRYETGSVVLDAPVSGTIYGTLLNYKGSLAALGEAMNAPPYQRPPEAPILYIKPANTVIGNMMAIPAPDGVKYLEAGAALGIVIGRAAFRVRQAQAMEYVAGYTIANDVSIPHSSYYRPAIKEKCRDGFCPVGPWIIGRGEVGNPDDLRVRVYVNGELKQENTTANLVRSVARLIEDVTSFMTLHAGDILLAGVPEGAPLVKQGDRVKIEIEGVGVLENIVRHEKEAAKDVCR